MTGRDKIDSILRGVDQLGVIGSPSSTSELTLDILGSAVARKLVGELALFRFKQDSLDHYALGQLTEIEMKNVWQEAPIMRSLVRQRGFIEAISERHDNHLGQMIVSAVFSKSGDKRQGYKSSSLGTVPPTGTNICAVSDQVLDELLLPYKDQLFYLGNVYGSEPRLPMWFKHFGTGAKGAGEAYHLGIFGRTGSGKSVLAKMILLGYMRHENMSFLVIDPQGEFAKDMRGERTGSNFDLPVKKLAQSVADVEVLRVSDLVLDRWELFTEILFESNFFQDLTIPRGDNRRVACDTLRDRLKKSKVKLADLSKDESFGIAWSILGDESVQKIFYRSADSRKRFDDAHSEADTKHFHDLWKQVAELFNAHRQGAKQVDRALRELLSGDNAKSKALVIDLSGEETEEFLWNEKIQSLVVRRLLRGIARLAEEAYKDKESLNALVLIDEAHRFAPRTRGEDDIVRDVLIDAVRTTRKYGLGWMFISQTMSSLHRDILGQLRIWFIGFGLGLGLELQALREIVGAGSALKLYQSFADPHSSFDIENRQYSFMTIGPASPLSFSGTPLFLNVFNDPKEFVEVNRRRSKTK